MFHENSAIVKLWIKYIDSPDSAYTRESVPKLSNLQEVVYKILDARPVEEEIVTEEV